MRRRWRVRPASPLLPLLAFDRAGDIAHQSGDDLDGIVDGHDAHQRAASVDHRRTTKARQSQALKQIAELVAFVRREWLTAHDVIDCDCIRIDVACHHAEHQIAIRQHADRLAQHITFAMHDQKSDMLGAHQLGSFSCIRARRDRDHALVATLSNFHDALSAFTLC
jgi:hypothetical protein